MGQAACAANAAVLAGHTLNKVATGNPFTGAQQGSAALFYAVADNRGQGKINLLFV